MSSGTNDEFKHQIAIKLSRALNSLNPNDLLAERVIDFAKTNTTAGFISAARTFGSYGRCSSTRAGYHRY